MEPGDTESKGDFTGTQRARGPTCEEAHRASLIPALRDCTRSTKRERERGKELIMPIPSPESSTLDIDVMCYATEARIHTLLVERDE